MKNKLNNKTTQLSGFIVAVNYRLLVKGWSIVISSVNMTSIKNQAMGLSFLLAAFMYLLVAIPTVQAADPVGYWKFDEGVVTPTAIDSSGNGNNGTAVGSPTYSSNTPSEIDFTNPYSINFNGIDQGVNTPVSLNNLASFSLAGWAYPRTASTSAGWFGANDVFEFIFDSETSVKCWTARGAVIWTFNPATFLNKWHYIACAGDVNTLSLYIDGDEVASTTPAVGVDYGTGDNFSIGIGVQNGGVDGPFDGLIDDVRVYNVALSPEEMKSLGNGADVPVTNPFLQTSIPADNATGVALAADLVATFSTSTIATSTGAIELRKLSGDALVESISVTGNQVTKNGSTITINPTADLEEGVEYYVSIPATAFVDGNGEFYLGTEDNTTWNFTALTYLDRTLVIDTESYLESYDIAAAAPTLNTTLSAGSGVVSFTSQTTGVCTVNTSGVVSFVSTGVCRIIASVTNDGTYKAVNTTAATFSVTRKSADSSSSTRVNTKRNSQGVINETKSNVPHTFTDIVLANRGLFEKARDAGISLPSEVLAILNGTTELIPVRDLYLDMEGEDVRQLQQLLIDKNTGASAQELKRVGATGFFSTYTKNALGEYQLQYAIEPHIGYFGIITRTQMKSAALPGLWW